MPQHGVTTVLIGNCSLSLAPLRPEQRDGLSAVFAYVEDMPPSVFAEAVPWSWTTFPEYLDSAPRAAVRGQRRDARRSHTAADVRHGRRRVGPPGNSRRAPRDGPVLDEALVAGALGLSTSWFDEDAHKRPTPSVLADDDELGELLDVLVDRGAFLEFIPDVKTSAWRDDVARVARLTGPRGLVSTFNGIFCDNDRPGRILEILDHIGELQAAGRPAVSAGLTPRRRRPRELVRRDVVLRHGDHLAPRRAGRRRREASRCSPIPSGGARPATSGTPRSAPCSRTGSPSACGWSKYAIPQLEPWIGRTLAELVAERGGHPSDVLADWMLENDLEPGVVGVDVTNADVEGVAAMLRHPAAIISNSDAGAHLQMMCASGDTTLLLTRHVRERGDFTLEDAIWQLTGRQAATFGMPDRGVLRPGAIADVTVFALDELHWDNEEFVTDLPGRGPRFRRPAGGYRYTVVRGEVTQEHDALTGSRPGRLVERS